MAWTLKETMIDWLSLEVSASGVGDDSYSYFLRHATARGSVIQNRDYSHVTKVKHSIALWTSEWAVTRSVGWTQQPVPLHLSAHTTNTD